MAMVKPTGYEPVDQSETAATIGKHVDSMDIEEQAPAPPPPKVDQTDLPMRTVAFSVLFYAACSSTLLLINKVAMHFVPDASFILFCQFVTSSLAVRVIKLASPDSDIEFLRWEKARPFFLACLIFFLCLLANTAALKSVNVETVIVARSCAPIAVSILEHFTLGRNLPTLQGTLALLVFIVTEMVFVKFIVDTVPMSTWTRVYYNNTLSIPLVLLSSTMMGFGGFLEVAWAWQHIAVVGLSCVVGVAISYSGFHLRKMVSATTFTVIGVLCKLMTVMLNDIVWSQHSNLMGHIGLLLCIAAGFAYERTKVVPK